MRVTVRLFASLRKRLPRGSPRGSCELDVAGGATIADVLATLDIPAASAKMILVNGHHGEDLSYRLSPGDVLSVFPPLAGG